MVVGAGSKGIRADTSGARHSSFPAPSKSHRTRPSSANGVMTAQMVVQQCVDRLMTCVQPDAQSELRRYAIAAYITDLIKRCFHGGSKSRTGVRVNAFMFGSVPLKAYLPDGDVDISIFTDLNSTNPMGQTDLVSSWAIDLKKYLDNEAALSKKSRDSSTTGKNVGILEIEDVQIIQAEVKLVKCIVSGLEVDVSFNALGGLCGVGFLEWCDRTIGRSHLLKKSIILVKAWCYYESRLLGAHHGLLSSYALEVMVLFIINIYGTHLMCPLDTFQRFLQVFAEFDFDNYCLSVFGPIPLDSFPHPHIDEQQLPLGARLLSAEDLRDSVREYSAKPKDSTSAIEWLSPELSCSSSEKPNIQLVKKHLNIMDPLLPSNNLGRSVSRTSYVRMKMAFSHGAKSLTYILQHEPSVASQKISLFFNHTWSSTHRVAIENRMFAAMAAGLPQEYLVLPNQMQNQASPYHVSQGSMDVLPRPGATLASRKASSASLPDLALHPSGINTNAKMGYDTLEASMETHDGVAASPTKRRNDDELGDRQDSIESSGVATKSQIGSEMSLELPPSEASIVTTESHMIKPRPRHRRANSVASTISIGSGTTIFQIPHSIQTLKFMAGGNSGTVGNGLTSNQQLISNNIEFARNCQPKLDNQHEWPLNKETETNQDPTAYLHPGVMQIPTESGTSGTMEQGNRKNNDSSGITYASVTAHGLTPTSRSRALSRRDSMSVNASVSVSPRSESSPHLDDTKNAFTMKKAESLKNSTPGGIANDADTTGWGPESNRGVDAQSLSRELKTWSVIAQQPPQVKNSAVISSGAADNRSSNPSSSDGPQDKTDDQPMSWKHKVAQ